ncbi:MAG: Imm10 family immunity protein [Nannocystaceae bacterium]|nr:Imm10 family immunity protein [bacterium]
MATLHAKAVFCGELSEGVVGIIAAEEESGDGARVELMRATGFEEQDRALGQDTYCLSLHTGASVYGGVARWLLAPGQLKLELSEEAADALDLDDQLTIEFDAERGTDLSVWLPKVLG